MLHLQSLFSNKIPAVAKEKTGSRESASQAISLKWACRPQGFNAIGSTKLDWIFIEQAICLKSKSS